MTRRITMGILERRVKYLNELTGNNTETWTTTESGERIASIGTFYICGAYGGVKLVRISNESGGVRSITPGYYPKRQTLDMINAYIEGIRDAKEGRV